MTRCAFSQPEQVRGAKCDFYMPKDSTAVLQVEGKEHLLRRFRKFRSERRNKLRPRMALRPMKSCCLKLADVPTPAGPTRRKIDPGLLQTTFVRPAFDTAATTR